MKTPKQQAQDLIIKGCEEMGRETDEMCWFEQGKIRCIPKLNLEDLLAVMIWNDELGENLAVVVNRFDYTKSFDQNLDRPEFSKLIIKILS